MKLVNLFNNTVLNEYNIANAGQNVIYIKDAEGNEVDHINTFDRIVNKFLSKHTKRAEEETKKWFNANFKKWLKKGAEDPDNQLMDKKKFQDIFYVHIDDYITSLLNNHPDLVNKGLLSKEIIMKSFPDYIQKDPTNATIFSGGRLFRLNKIVDNVSELIDYMVAVQQNSATRNDDILPPHFMFKRLDTMSVPEAIKRAQAWHRYTEQQAEKVSTARQFEAIKTLKPGVDYKVIDQIGNATFVQLLTAHAAEVEGLCMKHCVASYGSDVEHGRTIIYSVRDQRGLPQATIEMSKNLKKATQVKGRRNSTIAPELHNDIRTFFKKHKISPTETKHFGGMKEERA